MSDGKIVIDVSLDSNQVKSDAKLIEQIMKSIGNNAGQGMASSFNHNANQITHQAQQTAHNIQQQLSHPVNVHLNLNSSNATHNATSTFNSINHQAQQTEEHLHSLKDVFEGTFLANAAEAGLEMVKSGIEKLVETGMEYNKEQDKMVAVWTTLAGSASSGKVMVDMINNFQKSTGYATESLNEMAQKIYHIKGSVSETKDMVNTFTTLGDAMGLSNDRLVQVSEYFSHMMASGRATATDINIMTNAFPAFGEALTKTMGKSMGKIRKMTRKGLIPADVIEQTLMNMQGKYKDAIANMQGTTSGLTRTIQSNWGRLAGDFTKPIFSMQKSGFKDLSAWLGSSAADKMFTNMGKSIASVAGKLVDFIQFLAKHRSEVLGLGKDILILVGSIMAINTIKTVASSLNIVSEGIKAFMASTTKATLIMEAMEGPVGWIILGIAALGVAFITAYNKSKPFHDFVNGIGKSLKNAWNDVAAFSKAIAEMFQGKWTQGGSILEKLGLSSTQIQAVKKAVHDVEDVFDKLKKTVTEVFNKYIKPVVVDVFDTIKKSVEDGMGYMWKTIKPALDTLKKYWNEIFPELEPALKNLWTIIKTIFEVELFPLWTTLKIELTVLKSVWKDIWNTICSVLKTVWDVIIGVIQSGWDIISGIFKVIIDLLSGHFSKAWKDMKETVVNTLHDLWKNVQKIAGDIGDVFTNLGKTIADGLISGLAAGVNAVSGGINWILDKVHAPSHARIPSWNPPHFANGTDGHQGGLAVVGDGKKKELVTLPNGRMFLSPSTDTIMNLPKGTQVLDGNNTEKLMGMGLIPKYANGIGGAWDWVKSKASSAWGNISDIAKNIWSYASDPSKLLSTVVGKFTNLSKFLNPELGLAEGAIGTASKYAASWVQSFFSFGGSSGSAPSGNVPGTVQQWLATAMNKTNTPMNYLGALEAIAMHESGGNPHAVNLWDSNARAGHPSKGLMQTIDGTFNQYSISGLGDIWNPVANAVAAIRYMKAVYGSISNVPGVRSLSRGGGYVGYANGTANSVGGQVVIGENEPELIQTQDGRTVLATHATSFNDFMEGSTVTPLSKIPHYANGVLSKAKSVLNSVGNPTLSTTLVRAALSGNSKENVIQVDIQPIVVQSVLDGKIIAQTVTNVQSQNTVRNSRLRGEI